MQNNDHNGQPQQSNSFPNKRASIWPMPGSSASDLLVAKHRLLVTPDVINAPSFSLFYSRWISGENLTNVRPLYAPGFELSNYSIPDNYNAIKVLQFDGCNDYFTLLSLIKKYGSWVLLTNDSEKADEIIQASKTAGSYLRVYRLDREGNLRYHRLAEKPATVMSIPSFELTDILAPIRRLTRKETRKYRSGDEVYTSHGEYMVLGDEFMSDSKSITYYTDKQDFQAKIYEPQFLMVSYFEDKARRMLEKPINEDGICWPQDILINKSGEFVGVLVKSARGFQLKQLMSQQGLADCFPNWNRLDLTHVTKIILDKIIVLHNSNILFGVLNPSSIFVEDREHVYFAEMDAYQIEGYPVLAHEKVMQAPELQDQRDELQLYTMQQDNYEVALLIFMLLMPGKFPYIKGKNKDISESIKKMSFAFKYGKKGEEHGAREYFGLWRFVWSHLGNDLKQAFYYTFQSNQPYSTPDQRRDVYFWLKKIKGLEHELMNPYDIESLQVFPKTFKRYIGTKTIKCETCGIEHPDFYYKYPDKKICNSCLGKPSSTHFECRSCGKSFYYDFGTLFKYEKYVEEKDYDMPTHCPYCRSDKQKCIDCMKWYPIYRLNEDGRCYDCSKNARERIAKRYVGICGHEIVLTQGQVDFYLKKFGNLPKRCKTCQAQRKNRY